MSRDERLGDKMPARKTDKFSEMKAGSSHLSEEWHEMEPTSPRMSEKWVEQHPSTGRMSEKWDEFENTSNVMGGAQWDVLKQEKRVDPYAMHHSDGNLKTPFKPMAKQKADGGKVERSTQHNEFGSTREI